MHGSAWRVAGGCTLGLFVGCGGGSSSTPAGNAVPDAAAENPSDAAGGMPVEAATDADASLSSEAGVVVAGSEGGADAGADATAAPPAGTPGARSGLPWMSGSNGDPIMESMNYDAFATWRGRPLDVAMIYTDRASWSKLTGPDAYVFPYTANWPGKLVVSQPPFPDDGTSNLKDCAAGTYDAYWKTFGTSLVSNGRADSIVRIAWEFNGDFWYYHATNDTQQFIQCWNHVASSIKATDPQVLTDWTINSKYTPTDSCNGDPRNCYPGDAYVDYIGIDDYDEYPPSTTTPFDTIATAPGGLTWIHDFAVQHHKRFGVGEWGVVSAGSQGGGDNPAFIQNMRSWFQAHASAGLYECYFGTDAPGEVDSKILDTATGTCGCDNPMASAKYRALYHP
jgi:hypothetical protein